MFQAAALHRLRAAEDGPAEAAALRARARLRRAPAAAQVRQLRHRRDRGPQPTAAPCALPRARAGPQASAQAGHRGADPPSGPGPHHRAAAGRGEPPGMVQIKFDLKRFKLTIMSSLSPGARHQPPARHPQRARLLQLHLERRAQPQLREPLRRLRRESL